MSKKVGIGYSFKEKEITKENEELKKAKAELIKENEKLKVDREMLKNKLAKLTVKKPEELSKAEIQKKLKEAGIEYNEGATKEELKALLPQE